MDDCLREVARDVRGRGRVGRIFIVAAFLCFRATAGVGPAPPAPEQGNTFDLYVGGEEEYDGNLYRLPAGRDAPTAVAPDASRSDRITIASAGADLQRLVGRQAFIVDLHADENRFAKNTFLDNTSGYAKLLWDWQVGPYLSGTTGANYSRGLVSFGEALYLGRDLLEAYDYFGTARLQVVPHWAIYGGISDSILSHTAAAARGEDFRTKAGNLGTEYALTVTDTFGVEYRYDQGQYPAGQVFSLNGATFSPNFHDDTLLFTAKHAFSDKTQLTADAGYKKRFYPDTTAGSFAGEVWRVTVNWEPTGKTQVAVAQWRELHAYLVSQSNYFVSTGGSVTPTWNVTEKFSASLVASYESQNYIPESTTVITSGPLNAHVAVEEAILNYSPRDAWHLSLAYIHSTRNANTRGFEYGDDLATFSVLYKTR